jgi:hypothetical protein
MKTVLVLGASVALALGCSGAFARGGSFAPSNEGTFIVPHGTTSGPVTINNPTSPVPTTRVINNGTIAGGTKTGLTITGPTPTTVSNNGVITSNMEGISISGSPSAIFNTGTISARDISTGTATATGISQTAH